MSTTNTINLSNEIYYGRIIFITEDITMELATVLTAQLLCMDKEKEDDITIYINSNGGDIHAAFMIINTMNSISSIVKTVNMGIAGSAAALILAAGEEGYRYAYKNTSMLIHEPAIVSNSYMNIQEMKKRVSISNVLRESITEILYSRSALTEEQIDQYIREETMMTASQAYEYGFIDHIL